MTLCLMVYNVAQHWLRERLEEKGETLPNQVKKPIQNPTMRWIFRLMQGISRVRIFNSDGSLIKVIITNLSELKRKIIHFFGDYAIKIYGMGHVCEKEIS